MNNLSTAVEHAWRENRTSEQLFVEFEEKIPPKSLAAMIDHTLLKPQATWDDMRTLCQEAREYKFASVCVNPFWVSWCAELLDGSSIPVCSVAGFPLGAAATRIKAEEAQQAVSDGAREIDMVLNIGALKAGKFDLVHHDIRAVVEAIEPALCKVIIEACLLSDYEKVAACVIVKKAGAHFVKTSTGFSTSGATIHDVGLMRRVVGSELGVKAAGGICDYKTAVAMVNAGATRIGASAGVKILTE